MFCVRVCGLWILFCLQATGTHKACLFHYNVLLLLWCDRITLVNRCVLCNFRVWCNSCSIWLTQFVWKFVCSFFVCWLGTGRDHFTNCVRASLLHSKRAIHDGPKVKFYCLKSKRFWAQKERFWKTSFKHQWF